MTFFFCVAAAILLGSSFELWVSRLVGVGDWKVLGFGEMENGLQMQIQLPSRGANFRSIVSIFVYY